MHTGSTIEPSAPSLEPGPVSAEREELSRRRARALSLEFTAPVGLLETDRDGEARWAARVGDESIRWPRPERADRVAGEGGGDPGGAALWYAGPPEEHLWLILRMPPQGGRPGVASTTAWVGFAAPGVKSRPPGRAWGPSVPPQALLAWGREVVGRLAGDAGSPGPGGDRSRVRLPDRLTREMHVSDPPGRFQRLAVQSLRDAMAVAAVAWVPRSRRDPVVMVGAIEGLGPEAVRLLLPDRMEADAGGWDDRPFQGVVGVEHALAVSSDTEGAPGWLVAINPMDGRPFGRDEADLLRPVASLISAQRSNARHYAELKELLFGVIRSLTAAIDAKDPYTLGHSERVGRIAVELGEELGVSANERGDLYLCGLLHDVGKIGVSDAVLQKPGPLTGEEFDEIRQHVRIGVQILSDLKKLNHLLPGVAHHHENFDGSGYPDGLAGEAIPRIARILAVADAFDAMSSTRPYRRRLAAEQIDRIFRDGSGVQWDPAVVDALFACRPRVERIRQKGLGDSVMQVVDDTVGRAHCASISRAPAVAG
ncbi:HD-GYP domain-containing protein [Tautonia plasticadhaerens]|uniref:Cyclic di-GMP phosphodiesterase response regulator RpfG n=1 Tax=Tautonia plasticadhaerens TaxID=2527974 RepID=A0A518GWP2_9BACT|nr:HD-GYP domain-containing protein [Tautonia plasticadhaerens]QDV33014.1 Cyclic di-GMP phosphodiesterase response regulator RpfG [Tautonia plasticadhaerens]